MVCVSIPCSEVCILKPQMIIRPKLMLFFIVSLKTSVQMTSCEQFQGDIYVFVKYISYYTSFYQVIHLILDSSIKTTKKTSQVRSVLTSQQQSAGINRKDAALLQVQKISLYYNNEWHLSTYYRESKRVVNKNKFCIRKMARFLQRTSQLWIKRVLINGCYSVPLSN